MDKIICKHEITYFVLLVSKLAGHSPEIPEIKQDKSAGVLHSQRALAEVIEMIRTCNLHTSGIIELASFE